MISKLIAFAIVLLSTYVWSCEVRLPAKVLILGSHPGSIAAESGADCSPELLRELDLIIESVDGKIASYQLEEMLKSKGFIFNARPNVVEVKHLRHLVREQLNLPTGINLKSSEAMNSQNFVALESGDDVQVQCQGCLFGSQQPLNLVITGFDGVERTMTVKADFKKQTRAYRLVTFQAAFSELSKEALIEEFVESIPHTDLVTNLEHLRFYKTNKPLRSGEILRMSDLTALSLVKAGLKTEVIIENSHLKLKTHGISRNNGSLGELVEVYHPEKNKKYLGKVIDINRVLVDL